MCEGWIKLHRKIWDWPYSKDPEHLSIWMYLLTHANHKEANFLFEGKQIQLKAGQLITGRKEIARVTNVSESKIQRFLKKLEIEHQIEQQTCNKNRVITILNWTFYQTGEQQNEQQVNNNRTTSEQQVNTNKNDNNKNNDKKYTRERVKDFEEVLRYFEKVCGFPVNDTAKEQALIKWEMISKSKKTFKNFQNILDKRIEEIGKPHSLPLFLHQNKFKFEQQG